MGGSVIVSAQQHFAVIEQAAKNARQAAVAVYGDSAFGFDIGMAGIGDGITDVTAVVFRQHNVVQGRLFTRSSGIICRIFGFRILGHIRFRFFRGQLVFVGIIVSRTFIFVFFRIIQRRSINGIFILRENLDFFRFVRSIFLERCFF